MCHQMHFLDPILVHVFDRWLNGCILSLQLNRTQVAVKVVCTHTIIKGY